MIFYIHCYKYLKRHFQEKILQSIFFMDWFVFWYTTSAVASKILDTVYVAFLRIVDTSKNAAIKTDMVCLFLLRLYSMDLLDRLNTGRLWISKVFSPDYSKIRNISSSSNDPFSSFLSIEVHAYFVVYWCMMYCRWSTSDIGHQIKF